MCAYERFWGPLQASSGDERLMEVEQRATRTIFQKKLPASIALVHGETEIFANRILCLRSDWRPGKLCEPPIDDGFQWKGVIDRRTEVSITGCIQAI